VVAHKIASGFAALFAEKLGFSDNRLEFPCGYAAVTLLTPNSYVESS
jgi:hypothetical protein